jgi:hypothetical protein
LLSNLRFTLTLAFLASVTFAFGKPVLPCGDTTLVADTLDQKDMIDVIRGAFGKKSNLKPADDPKTLHLSFVPTLGYTLSTGFAAGISGIATFYTQPNKNGQESVINAQAFYDSHSQQTFFVQSNIWAANDQLKFVTDLRITKYPDVTYGLGNNAT